MENNIEKKPFLKNWIIKKLLSTEKSKDEVLNYIASNENIDNNQELEDNNEKSLIKNILNLDTKSVEDIMVPRAEIISIEKSQTKEQIFSIIRDESHSRMPVYKNNLDNVLGFIHIKDLLTRGTKETFDLDSFLRDVLYVAPKSPILDLLKRMRSSRIHMGLVVDEFGGVDGLITIEDLVEEIVGEIEDEHDVDSDEDIVKKIDNNTIIVNSSYKILDLKKYFHIEINLEDEDEIDTIGGLVFYIANKVPKNNQIYKYSNTLQFKIIKASARKVETVEIKKLI